MIDNQYYTTREIQAILGNVSRQRIFWLAKRHNWQSPHPGLYNADQVDAYLRGRNIEPQRHDKPNRNGETRLAAKK